MKQKVTIIDYNAGNLKSIVNMLSHLGIQYETTQSAEKLLCAEKIIFPGQGHFAQAMKNLENFGLVSAIKNVINAGVPFLGICLGLQVLFEESEEAPNVKGLAVFRGNVKKFVKGKTPQIGWNKISVTGNNSHLTEGYYYFVNSYYVNPSNKNIISATTDYYGQFCSAVEKNNITAVQFHPEKSSDSGIAFFDSWLRK